MILEGLVTTLDEDGALNLAPMGPRVAPDFRTFTLRPFRTSRTYANLIRHGEGVLHVTDDVLLLARASIGKVTDAPTRPAARVHGRVLEDCCRYYEFKVTALDESEERARFEVETAVFGRVRDVFGFNRAQHAVIETAILATRLDFFPPDAVAADLERYRVLVDKTGGDREHAAFALLEAHIQHVRDHA